jgi:D-inositol-3-phosphate glycosyltransferase
MSNRNNKSKPLIGFYCSSIAWGGLEMNTVRYASWMMSSGYDVVVFCVDESPIHQAANKEQLPIQLILRNKKYFDLFNARKVSQILRAQGVRLIWFRDTRDMDLLFWAKRLFGIKMPYLYQQAMQFGISKKDPFHTLRFGCIDAWVSTLPFLANQVKTMTRFPKNRIYTVPLGVLTQPTTIGRQEARHLFGLSDDAFVIGLMGRIDVLKGQHEALNALHILHRAGHKFHLLLVGDSTLHEGDAYRKQLLYDIKRLQLEEFVHLQGHTAQVAEFYECLDCFLMCSKGETFGTVTIEAMAYETPIIATNSGGSPEILDHGRCGQLYTPGDASALAQCIAQVATDKYTTSEKVLAASNRFEEEFSAEISIQRMSVIVEKLIND